MPAMIDALPQATQQLERAVENLGAGPAGREVVESSLTACLATLESVRDEAARTAAGSLDLVRLEARASENIDLAGLSLQRQEGATDGNDVAALQHALFHTRRALDYFHHFAEAVTERTRATDRERNRKEFLSG